MCRAWEAWALTYLFGELIIWNILNVENIFPIAVYLKLVFYPLASLWWKCEVINKWTFYHNDTADQNFSFLFSKRLCIWVSPIPWSDSQTQLKTPWRPVYYLTPRSSDPHSDPHSRLEFTFLFGFLFLHASGLAMVWGSLLLPSPGSFCTTFLSLCPPWAQQSFLLLFLF